MSRFPRVPLRHLSDIPITNGLGLPGSNDNPDWPRYIRTTDIASPTRLRNDVFASQPPAVASSAMVSPGDLLMTAAGASIGKSVRFTESYSACYAGFLVRLRPRSTDAGRYLGYWMQSVDYWDQIAVGAVKSTIENFSAGRYRALRVPSPLLEEQRAIADYLDHETAQIDALVAKQEKFIGLLRERRAAHIDHIFEAGDLTQRTKVGRLLSKRPTYGVLVPRYVTALDSVPFVRVGDLHKLSPGMDLPSISRTQSYEYGRTRLVGGEVLLGVVGRMGVAAVVPMWLAEANVARAVSVLRPVDRSYSRLLCAWFSTRHFLRQAISATIGDSVQPTLGMADLTHFELHWPNDIALAEAALDGIARIDALIAKAKEHIALAKERRSALITAAVTGHFEVRTAQKES